MKKALLAVSFGSSVEAAVETCIAPVEAALSAAFPGWKVCRAFTSRVILSRLRERGVQAEGVEDALARLKTEDYGEIVVAPTHIIPGGEYEKVCRAAAGYRVAEPLLANEEDCAWMAALLGDIAAEEGRPLLAMGHGSDHAADGMYARLREKLPRGVFLACAEGAHPLESALPALARTGRKELVLAPLTLCAGMHAQKLLAGEKSDSWKTKLAAQGYDVRVRMQGLGALAPVQRRFAEKAARVVGMGT